MADQKEKKSKWRLSRHHGQPHPPTHAHNLSPRKGLGSDPGAGTSTSSVGSSALPRKSFTGDTVPASSDPSLVGTHLQSSNESGSAVGGSGEEKKGPFGWIKNKMREKREEKDAEKERTKSPPAPADRFSRRGKSMDIRRDDPPPVPPLPTHSSMAAPLPTPSAAVAPAPSAPVAAAPSTSIPEAPASIPQPSVPTALPTTAEELSHPQPEQAQR